jgi:hypothetical protein
LLYKAAQLLPAPLEPAQEATHDNEDSDAGMLEVLLGDTTVRILGAPDPATLTLVLQRLRA